MDTAERIIETAEGLMQEHGFHGFSFQDIADAVGIKKASIHYHFPAKAKLGQAVVDRYRKRMSKAWEVIEVTDETDHWQALSVYLEPIIQLGRTPGYACLCGVLGGEYLGLPKEIQNEIKAFFEEHELWLSELLENGRIAGTFQFKGSANTMAKLLFSIIQGGLLIKRIKVDRTYIDELVEAMGRILGRSG